MSQRVDDRRDVGRARIDCRHRGGLSHGLATNDISGSGPNNFVRSEVDRMRSRSCRLFALDVF